MQTDRETKSGSSRTLPEHGVKSNSSSSQPTSRDVPPQADSTSDRLKIIEHLIERQFKPKQPIFSTFKNRILVSTLLVVVGAVVIIGISLQITVFPKLRGDDTVISNIKTIHFLASLAIIALSWLFIERISRTISAPLLELTKRADEISKKAGIRLAETDQEHFTPDNDIMGYTSHRDEIVRLTSSFNRMLAHLKASETMLRESEEKYRFLFNNGPSPIFVLDMETLKILDVNARAEEEYQFTREEFLDMSFSDLGMQVDKEGTCSRLRMMLTSKEETPLPVIQHKRREGSTLMVNFQARTSSYQDNPAIITAVWDVTETLEKQTRLIQAGKMATLGEMATGIAHELNQPLNVIKLGCDFLAKRIKRGKAVEPDELGYVADQMNSSVERASKIINHLRQFGRKNDMTMRSTDVREAIINVFGLLGRQLEARGIHWELDFEDDLPRIMGDVNRLEQVFINLVINSRDAIVYHDATVSGKTEKTPKLVSIRAFKEGNRLVITVADTGPGIPKNIIDKVFEPFFTTKRPGEGTGLGLSISYGIVKDHRGSIEVLESTEKGTTFRLTFPILSNGDSDGKNSLGG
jgi:PAS domain S-box-containing protein